MRWSLAPQRRNVVTVNKSECLFMNLKGGGSSASFGSGLQGIWAAPDSVSVRLWVKWATKLQTLP